MAAVLPSGPCAGRCPCAVALKLQPDDAIATWTACSLSSNLLVLLPRLVQHHAHAHAHTHTRPLLTALSTTLRSHSYSHSRSRNHGSRNPRRQGPRACPRYAARPPLAPRLVHQGIKASRPLIPSTSQAQPATMTIQTGPRQLARPMRATSSATTRALSPSFSYVLSCPASLGLAWPSSSRRRLLTMPSNTARSRSLQTTPTTL